MAPIIFKRTSNADDRRPRRIITKDLTKLQDEDDLSPLEMERKFVLSNGQDDDNVECERVTTPETLDSVIMTFSDDDSFGDDPDEEDDMQFGHGQFDEKWWEWEETPAKVDNNMTTTNLMPTITPFSKLAIERSVKRVAFSPFDSNKQIQWDIMRIQDNNCGASGSPFNISKQKSYFSQTNEVQNQEVNSPAKINAELDLLWKNTKAARQPYVSPFSKKTLARNAEGKPTMPPTYSQPSKEKKKSQWVQFTPVKDFNVKSAGKTVTTPFSNRKNRRPSPMLSPLDPSAFLTPAKEDNPKPNKLFHHPLEEEQGVVEIKVRTKSGEENDDHSVISGLTRIDEVDDDEVANSDTYDIWGVIVKHVEEDSFDSGAGLLSQFLHNFLVSSPPTKSAITPAWSDEIEL